MKLGRFVVGIVIVAVLAFVVYRELATDEETGVRTGAEIVFPYNSYRVAEFTLAIEGTEVHLRREGGAWVVVSGPEGARADVAADVIAAWTRVRFMETLKDEPSAEELALYGLDTPVAVATAVIKVEEGRAAPAHPPRLEIGKALPLVPGFYARVDGFPRVVAVSPEAAGLSLGIGRELLGWDSKLKDPER